jgi:hypothetical protein
MCVLLKRKKAESEADVADIGERRKLERQTGKPGV